MIKFVAGFVVAWILIKNPGVPAELLSAVKTIIDAVVTALRASGRVG